MKVLSPVGDIRQVERTDKLAPRPSNLAGKVVGIISNGAGDAYFKRIEELLTERAKVAQITKKIKPLLSAPCPPESLEETAKASGAVIVGIGV